MNASAATGNPCPPSLPINMDNAPEVARVTKEFARPFSEAEVKQKPQFVKGTRCLAVSYIDSRCVIERLNEVVSVAGWQDAYIVLPSHSVECRLTVWLGGQWITKTDVGSPSEQPDEGDRMKAAYSDALKRAAVKLGIGLYLYRLPEQWVDYDPVKRQILRAPSLGSKTHTPQAKSADAVSDSAKEIASLFDGAKSRHDGVAPYDRYDKALTSGKVSEADKAHIVAAMQRFGTRFPKNKVTT